MSLSRITSASIANSAISAADIADGTITAAKIISVANTQITGNIVSSQIAPSIVLNTPALGTPASGVLTNCTGVAAAALPAGSVLQVVQTQTGAVATTTVTIPFDDTIPQITEGAEFITLAITPKSSCVISPAFSSMLILPIKAAISICFFCANTVRLQKIKPNKNVILMRFILQSHNFNII